MYDGYAFMLKGFAGFFIAKLRSFRIKPQEFVSLHIERALAARGARIKMIRKTYIFSLIIGL
jgi:hypothetical protein